MLSDAAFGIDILDEGVPQSNLILQLLFNECEKLSARLGGPARLLYEQNFQIPFVSL